MNPLLEQFLNEARDNLSFLDKNLNKLEFNDPNEINALFRAAHTLKGGSGLVEFESIKQITHHAEDLLDGLRKGKLEFQSGMLDVLYDVFDEIVELIDAAEESSRIPDFDEDRIEELVSSIKVYLSNKEEKEESEGSLDTELFISTDNSEPIGELIAYPSISSLIKKLPIKHPVVDQDFIETDNFYLIDFDLDRQCVEFGNDPIYLISLLGVDEIYAVNTYIAADCEDIKSNSLEWYTRLTVVVRSNKDLLEDSLYNIIDDIKIFPLSVESLLVPSYESDTNDVYDDFVNDFKFIIQKNEYSQLNEKINAISKILNPVSKEYFILTRTAEVLTNFPIGSEEYKHIVDFTANILGIGKKNDSKNEEIKHIEEEVIRLSEKKPINEEEKTACNIILQQLKILKHNTSKESIQRVIEHTTNVLDFIGIDVDLENVKNHEELHSKLKNYIRQIDETLFAFHFAEENIGEKGKTLKEEMPKFEKDVIKTQDTKKEESSQSGSIPKTVKIDQEDIDAMMDIVGEILVMKNSLPYVANNMSIENIEQSKRDILNKYEEISRITAQLQDRVMGMRLLPLSYIFNRYPKLVRDISKRLGKKIKFEETGGDTKLDKNMIEKLADPLVHVIRNSLDHGIEENEQDRIEAGKKPEGLIKIAAESKGDKVYISVKDDGRGINIEKVIGKALENNLASVEEIEAMSDNEKLMLIFHPGLSTKDQISDLSGRGVGTDAVKKTVEELGGSLFLESEKGVGATLTMELPVSVALTKIFHVTMNGNNYGISMEQITETIKIKKEQIERANKKPFIKVRGELIPLVFEPNLLSKDKEKDDIHNIVVLQGKNSQFGLVVNEFVNQLDVVQKPLGGIFANHPMVSGTSLLGNGDIIFIIDAAKIVDDN